MSKEKFGLIFLAGGTLLDVLGTRLVRAPENPRESVGAAVASMGLLLDTHRDRLPDADAVGQQIMAIRQELCAPKPRRALLAGYVEELAEQVKPVSELAEAAELVRTELRSYLRWRFGGWTVI